MCHRKALKKNIFKASYRTGSESRILNLDIISRTLLLTSGLAPSGCVIHLVVFVTLAGQVAVHVNTQLIARISVQADINL